MGMGFIGSYAEVIEPDKLAAIAPAAWQGIQSLLTEDVADGEQDLFLQVMAYLWMPDQYGADMINDNWLKPESPLYSGADEEAFEQRVKLYEDAFDLLRKEFEAATAVGDSKLELYMGYHDCDAEGDRYDEVDGAYFWVDGCYDPTPAAKGLLKDGTIECRWFVTLC